jgi:hypothetical protein
VLIEATETAADWGDLTDGNLEHLIDLAETGTVRTNNEIWTGTFATGFGLGGCNDWTSANPNARRSRKLVWRVALTLGGRTQSFNSAIGRMYGSIASNSSRTGETRGGSFR